MWSRHRFLVIGALLVGLVCIGCTIVALRIRQSRDEEAKVTAQLLSHNVKLNVESFIGERVNALNVINALYRDGLIRSQQDFEYYSRQVLASPSLFRRVSLATPDYHLVYQFPPLQLAHNLKFYPDRYAFAENARLTRRLTVTDPVKLVPDGRLALAVYSPIYSGSEFKGIVIGLVDVAEFVEGRLKPALRGAPFTLSTAAGRAFYSTLNAESTRNAIALRVNLGDNAWRIGAGAPAASVMSASLKPELILIGLVLATAAGLAVLYLIQSGQLAGARRNLVEATRMATLGELATVIAHEIRNPLSSLASCTAALTRSVPQGSEDEALLGVCTREVFRLNQIVSDFLTFARPRALALQSVEVANLLDDVALAFSKDERWKKRITIIRPPRPRGPIVEGDPNMLLQVAWNLVTNAAQAISSEGVIVLDCMAEGGEARICVTDDGQGIAPKIQAKIFEPFFSTKASGLGLGLSIVKKIVADHGGSIRINSREEAGTEFEVRLPLTGEETLYGSTACA